MRRLSLSHFNWTGCEFKESQKLGTEGRVIYLFYQIKCISQLVADTPLTGSLILLQKIAKMKRAVIGGAR